MKKVKGDLIQLAKEGHFDAIVHGCNCFNTMGAGIAKSIKTNFPKAFEADMATKSGDKLKLGTITWAEVKANFGFLTIVNGYTQFHWKGPGRKVDYSALKSVFQAIKNRFSGRRIGYPAIGAGLAGGDWGILEQIIAEELAGEDHTFVEFKA